MNENYESICAALDSLSETLLILSQKLTEADEDDSHEALSILLMQGLELFGPESVLMQQLFPALDAIKNQLDTSDYGTAMYQTDRLWEQLDQVRALVRAGADSTGADLHSLMPPLAT